MSYIQKFYLYIILPLFFIFSSILYLIYPLEKFTIQILLFYSSLMMSICFVSTLDRKIINLFILFSASYLVPIFYNVFSNKIITSYNHSNSIEILSKYLLLYNLFFTILFYFIYKQNTLTTEIRRKNNYLIYYINVFICLFIAFFSKSGENIFTSGGYGLSEINNLGGFAIGEYFLIFFFVAYKYSGDSKFKSYILLITALLYISVSLAYGLRNELIQIAILIFILYFNNKKRKILYITFIILGLYFSSLFSVLRSDPISFMQNSFLENMSLKNIFNNENELYITHQGDVVHSSSRLINFRDNKIIDNSIIYSSSILFFSSIIIPQKYLPEQSNMASYKQDEYPVGGGGNIFAFFYFWFSYPGVIAIACFIGVIFKFYPKYINTIYCSYFIITLVTFPRWFSYSPINLFKMAVYGLILYFIFSLIDSLIKNNFKLYKYESS